MLGVDREVRAADVVWGISCGCSVGLVCVGGILGKKMGGEMRVRGRIWSVGVEKVWGVV
uniref:Transmembrane protein n=1 Tax=Bartonella schoenbuchensis (strain DSM 13525 / NCTC 13165 / R1) TaxID=687861 RepID=E6Z1D1_BARSR|nr:hypothetical protein BARSC_190192 [Bartonella schoenbuchensis R1]